MPQIKLCSADTPNQKTEKTTSANCFISLQHSALIRCVGIEVGHQHYSIIPSDTENELSKNSSNFHNIYKSARMQEIKTLFRKHLICKRLANLKPPDESYIASNCWFFSHHHLQPHKFIFSLNFITQMCCNRKSFKFS